MRVLVIYCMNISAPSSLSVASAVSAQHFHWQQRQAKFVLLSHLAFLSTITFNSRILLLALSSMPLLLLFG